MRLRNRDFSLGQEFNSSATDIDAMLFPLNFNVSIFSCIVSDAASVMKLSHALRSFKFARALIPSKSLSAQLLSDREIKELNRS